MTMEKSKLEKLNKKELIHLIEGAGKTDSLIQSLISNREHQRVKESKDRPTSGCFQCKMIALKLGVENG